MVPESFRWVTQTVNDDEAGKIAMQTPCSENFARLLAARGIHDGREAREFLNPDVNNMHDPFLMKGMREAADRIVSAIENGEKICIYGDYDVDGITATSILYLFLRDVLNSGTVGNADDTGGNAEINTDVKEQLYKEVPGRKERCQNADDLLTYYLPDRQSEGYGLNAGAVKSLAENGTRLIVTVDTGISAEAECRLAAELGVDVVVTDHHECPDRLPEAAAVVDAKQPGETYPFKYLAGCGVSFKLVQALAAELKWHEDIMKFLELAAVGTVADLVELVGENRIIVSEGFKMMRHPANLGLRKLLEVSGYDFHRKLTSSFIGFSAAPRLNAGGRMGDASRGVRLFTSSDEKEAQMIAEQLNEENANRKETEAQILEQVQKSIDESDEIRNSRVIIVAGEGWHSGVIGIVSSRIKDRYYRPNIIFSVKDGMATGSARSIPGFNLYDALRSCDDLFIKYGGHAAAAGMTLEERKLPELRRRLNEYAAAHMDADMLVPKLNVELKLDVSEVTIDLIHNIEKMEPFGQAMPEPVVRIDGMLSEIRAVGADKQTLRVRLAGSAGGGSGYGRYQRNSRITGVSFRRAAMCDYYSPGMRVSVAGTLSVDNYMNKEYPQIIIKDMHGQTDPGLRRLMDSFALRHVDESFEKICLNAEKREASVCAVSYRFLRDRTRRSRMPGAAYISLESAAEAAGEQAEKKIYDLLLTICVFEELGLIRAESSGAYLRYEMTDVKNVLLKDSRWFRNCFRS